MLSMDPLCHRFFSVNLLALSSPQKLTRSGLNHSYSQQDLQEEDLTVFRGEPIHHVTSSGMPFVKVLEIHCILKYIQHQLLQKQDGQWDWYILDLVICKQMCERSWRESWKSGWLLCDTLRGCRPLVSVKSPKLIKPLEELPHPCFVICWLCNHILITWCHPRITMSTKTKILHKELEPW